MTASAEFDVSAYLSTLTPRPGVYRMLGADGNVLYVGKAGNLRRRVSSYFRGRHGSPRIRKLVSEIGQIEVTVGGMISSEGFHWAGSISSAK